MNLIQGLQNDIIDSKISLSSVLRKAKVLASILKSNELKKWVDSELNGYQGDKKEVPDYRIMVVSNLGYFAGAFGSALKNSPIATLNLPEQIQKFAENHIMIEGVRALESLVEGESSTFQVHWPPNWLAIVGEQIYQGYNCIDAWKVISKGQVEQILDTVRNRLLNFVLELQEKYPEISKSEEAISTVPKEQVTSVFNTYIYGSHNVVASGSQVSQEVHQQVRVNDINSLLNYMKQSGLPATDVEELSKAITEDGHRAEPNKFGPKVAEWIGELTKKIGESTWKVAIGTTSALIAKAVSIYYGWE